MAFVSSGFEMVLTLIDTGANTSTKRFDLTSADYTEALADAVEIRTRILAATDANVSGYMVCEKFYDDAFSLPLGGVEIENQAMFVYQLDGDPRKKATFFLPAPKSGVFVSTTGKNRNVVNTTATIVTDIRTIFDNVTGMATISDGETALLIESGKRIHKRSSKG